MAAPLASRYRRDLMLLALFAPTALAAAPPECRDGALIDLTANPVVTLSASSKQVLLELHAGTTGPPTVSDATLGPPGFTAGGWSFSAADWLEEQGLGRATLEKGAWLRIEHGNYLETEVATSTDCLLTYDAGPVGVMLAERNLAEAKKRAAMRTMMVCDPEGTRSHAIQATAPASSIQVPIGQAGQGDGTFRIVIEDGDYKELAQQTVTIAGGKFVAASTTRADLFCPARSFADLCVKTEAAFTVTKEAPFSIATDVDWYELVLSRCNVSR